MWARKMGNVPFIIILLLTLTRHPFLNADETKRPFTVADDIQLRLFHNPNGDFEDSVLFSPDEQYFAVYSQRGRLDVNLVEDSVSFYRSAEVKTFLKRGGGSSNPVPFWTITRSAREAEDPITGADRVIRQWRWLPDSSGMAFLAPAEKRVWQLVLADVRTKKVEALTPKTLSLTVFDIHDRQNYVYTAKEAVKRSPAQAPALVATGHSALELFFPDDPVNAMRRTSSAYLWAVLRGRRLQVKANGVPVAPELGQGFALFPDGHSLATVVRLPNTPASWAQLYPPPSPSADVRLHAGQETQQFVRIDLKTGVITSLTDAPTSDAGGDWAYVLNGEIEWSRDRQSVLLPGTYLKSEQGTPSRPCLAVLDLPSKKGSCVEMLKGETEKGREPGYHWIGSAHFVKGSRDRVIVTSLGHGMAVAGTTEYRHAPDNTWQVVEQKQGKSENWHEGLRIAIKENLNQPPELTAANRDTSRVIWDPNPQLKHLELGEVSLYRWKDKAGRDIKGDLYKPVHFQFGKRYPLVIQTHGDYEDQFQPAGEFTTAFAAQEMAAAGIMVLQVSDRCLETGETPAEGPCAVSVYSAAVDQLAAEGLVDATRVGIIGFSHSCFYVMYLLTMQSALRLKAASVNDGFMNDYFQFMLDPSPGKFDPWNGTAPFGEGLQLWLKRSPSFNLDKASTPLLMMAGSGGERSGGIFIWGPYAGLYSLRKPVDLILLNSNEHAISNPAERLASQGTNLDWFRFWLQGYEDPDPAKAEQYKRWRELKKMQAEDEQKEPSQPTGF